MQNYIILGLCVIALIVLGMFLYFRSWLKRLEDERTYYKVRYSFELMLNRWIEEELIPGHILRNTEEFLLQQSKNFKYPDIFERLSRVLKIRLTDRDVVGGGYSGDPYSHLSNRAIRPRPQPNRSLGESEFRTEISELSDNSEILRSVTEGMERMRDINSSVSPESTSNSTTRSDDSNTNANRDD